MSGSTARFQAIQAVTNYAPISAPLNFAETPSSELFGTNVFSVKVMKDRLPKSIFKSVMKTIELGEPLDTTVADTVAAAMTMVAMIRCGRRCDGRCESRQ